MGRQRNLPTTTAVATFGFILLVACGPGGNGNGNGDGDGDGDGGTFAPGYCEVELDTTAALDVPLGNGLTGAEIFAIVEGQSTVSLHWDTSPKSDLELSFPQAPNPYSSVEVSLEAGSDTASFYTNTAVDPDETGIVCNDFVQVEVSVTLEGEDGSISEQATLTASMPSDPEYVDVGDSQPVLLGVWDMSSVEIDVVSPEGGTRVGDMELRISFNEAGENEGTLNATIRKPDDSEVTASIATWEATD